MVSILKDRVFCQHYRIPEIIGKGAFGTVYKCSKVETEEVVAVKTLSKFNLSRSRLKKVVQEARLLEQLDHPNIVRMSGFHESPHYFMIEMELLEGGTLEQRLQGNIYTEDEASVIMESILKAVSYLHHQNIIHRDIKPENIVFKDDSIESLKLTDFGLSNHWHIGNEKCGTALYMAPEQAVNKAYFKPVDIWSSGIVAYMLLTGKHPIGSPQDSIESYFEKLQNVQWDFPSELTANVCHFLKKLLDINCFERYSADQALRHPWITRQDSPQPLTYLEEMRQFNSKIKINKLLQMCIFMAHVKEMEGINLSKDYLQLIKNPMKHRPVETMREVKIINERKPTHRRANTTIKPTYRSISPKKKPTVILK